MRRRPVRSRTCLFARPGAADAASSPTARRRFQSALDERQGSWFLGFEQRIAFEQVGASQLIRGSLQVAQLELALAQAKTQRRIPDLAQAVHRYRQVIATCHEVPLLEIKAP
jgi:hypothetical protein